MRNHIVKVNIFVTPFEVVNNSLVCQFFLYYEKVLEEFNDPFVDIKVIEFRNHSLLILQIFFILVNESIALVNYATDVIENLSVSLLFKVS